MKVVQINANLTWVVFQDPVSRYWIGVCEALKISSQGKTVSDLRENIDDATNMMFRDLAERQELELFLRQHKWTLEGEMPAKPSTARFEIPYDIKRRTQDYLATVLG